MPSVGIITFHNSGNYGAVLQAYALQRVIESLGSCAEFVDYRNAHRGRAHLPPMRRFVNTVWSRYLRQVLGGKLRDRRTADFRKAHLRLSAKTYTDPISLAENPPRYDAYVAGSDQVWNPINNSWDSSYFLTFAPQGARRIAYAASFGLSLLPPEYAAKCSEWLKEFDFLSVREIDGQRIVRDLTGRDATLVLDPTLLLTPQDWRHVSVPHVAEKPYILCYYMPGDRLVDQKIAEIARQVSRETGWSIREIGRKEYYRLKPFSNGVFNAGPGEFLGLIDGASFVVTNSFHGTAFAINFGKPFVVPFNGSIPISKRLTSRVSSLLRTLSMEHRMVDVSANCALEEIMRPISSSAGLLHVARQDSIRFLTTALR